MQIDFEQFIERLRTELRGPLPGLRAHEPLRATPSGALKPKFDHKTEPKPGSILILLYPENGQIKFPLTKRPDYLGTHGGQISFPGGKAETGETVEQTALREGEEEIGIHSSSIEIIGRLSEFFVIPSNFMVTPIVGFQRTRPVFTPDPVEVVKVLEGDVEELMRDDAIQVKEIMAARIYPMRAPHFIIENEIVWGATAMILNELRFLLREKF